MADVTKEQVIQESATLLDTKGQGIVKKALEEVAASNGVKKLDEVLNNMAEKGTESFEAAKNYLEKSDKAQKFLGTLTATKDAVAQKAAEVTSSAGAAINSAKDAVSNADLNNDGKPDGEQAGGFMKDNKFGMIGAIGGAIIGMMMGGPMGAIIGMLLAGLATNFLADDKSKSLIGGLTGGNKPEKTTPNTAQEPSQEAAPEKQPKAPAVETPSSNRTQETQPAAPNQPSQGTAAADTTSSSRLTTVDTADKVLTAASLVPGLNLIATPLLAGKQGLDIVMDKFDGKAGDFVVPGTTPANATAQREPQQKPASGRE